MNSDDALVELYETLKYRELLPCPFCGFTPSGDFDFDRTANTYSFFVVCQYCESKSGQHYSSEQAIEAWNRRN